jgi:hypothetical protein
VLRIRAGNAPGFSFRDIAGLFAPDDLRFLSWSAEQAVVQASRFVIEVLQESYGDVLSVDDCVLN